MTDPMVPCFHEAVNRPPVGIAPIMTIMELSGGHLNTLFTGEHVVPVHYCRMLIMWERGCLRK